MTSGDRVSASFLVQSAVVCWPIYISVHVQTHCSHINEPYPALFFIPFVCCTFMLLILANTLNLCPAVCCLWMQCVHMLFCVCIYAGHCIVITGKHFSQVISSAYWNHMIILSGSRLFPGPQQKNVRHSIPFC